MCWVQRLKGVVYVTPLVQLSSGSRSYGRAEVPMCSIGIYNNCFVRSFIFSVYSSALSLSGNDYLCSVFCVYGRQQLAWQRNLYSLLLRYLQQAITSFSLYFSMHWWIRNTYQYAVCLSQRHTLQSRIANFCAIQCRKKEGFAEVMEDCGGFAEVMEDWSKTISQSLRLCHPTSLPPSPDPTPSSFLISHAEIIPVFCHRRRRHCTWRNVNDII